MDYLRDPQAIYAESFARVRAACDLSRLPAELEGVALRLVHACGMPEILDELAWSDGVVDAGRTALRAGAPVLCDCRMVAEGVIRGRLPADNAVVCTLPDPRVAGLARELETTRSAVAVDLWRDRLEAAVIAPLATAAARRREQAAHKAGATKVDFTTVTRGEDA